MKLSPRLQHPWFKCRARQWLLPALLGAGLTVLPLPLRAQGTPSDAAALLRQIEMAANRRDLEAVMAFYAPDFRADAAVDRAAISAGLAKLWERYDTIDYSTQLVNVSQQGDRTLAETVTEIRGLRRDSGRDVRLLATLRSRQTLQNNQIVSQETLAERTQIFVGANPPTVDINLPEQVGAGETFNFDVIVKEPLGGDLLLGGALEEEILGDRHLEPGDFELQLLQAGGIFKQGRAPEEPADRWLSAILIREDGITLVTQRLRVVSTTGATR